MKFREELKKSVLINSRENKVENALYQLQRMQANGTLDWYYVQLRDRLHWIRQFQMKCLKSNICMRW